MHAKIALGLGDGWAGLGLSFGCMGLYILFEEEGEIDVRLLYRADEV
jgi:hypothetical protein